MCGMVVVCRWKRVKGVMLSRRGFVVSAALYEAKGGGQILWCAQSTVAYVTPWTMGRRSSRTIVKAVVSALSLSRLDDRNDGLCNCICLGFALFG